MWQRVQFSFSFGSVCRVSARSAPSAVSPAVVDKRDESDLMCDARRPASFTGSCSTGGAGMSAMGAREASSATGAPSCARYFAFATGR